MTSDTLTSDVLPVAESEFPGVSDRANRRKTISNRLDYLATVEDGWIEGRGVALDRSGLLWLDHKMASHYVGTDLPLPFLCPSESGGVIGEWALERHTCMIEIDLDARTGSWVDVDMETGDGIDEQILDLDSADDWQWLTDRLAKFTAKP